MWLRIDLCQGNVAFNSLCDYAVRNGGTWFIPNVFQSSAEVPIELQQSYCTRRYTSAMA